jgi:uncharacterized repeat protein (TIGR01451 family)
MLQLVPKKTATAFLVLAVTLVPVAIWAWGPARPTFTFDSPSPYVTFNSITNNPGYPGGDERNFMKAAPASATNASQLTDQIAVQDGEEYLVQMYVHNNASANYNLVATGVKAQVTGGNGLAKSHNLTGFLDADNCGADTKGATGSHCTFWDEVNFTNSDNFTLSYVLGSGRYITNAKPNSTGGFVIPDSLATTSGALLGYDKLDGKIPGCNHYAGWLTFKVRAKVDKPAPKTSTYDLVKSVDKTSAKIGDTLNYTLKLTNNGETDLNNVVIKDALPNGLEWVNTLNVNVNNGEGISDKDKLFSTGVKVAKVGVGGTVTITFQAKVKSDAVVAEKCGTNSKDFVNKSSSSAEATVDGKTIAVNEKDLTNNNATTNVSVTKNCQPAYDVEKSVDQASAKPGDKLNYTVIVKNTGDVELTNVKLNDLLPANAKIQSVGQAVASPADGVDIKMTGGIPGYGMTVEIVKIPVSGQVKITYVVNLAADKEWNCGDTKITNKVVSSTTQTSTETDSSNNSASTVVSRACNSDFDIVKSVDKTTAKPGETIKYSLKFKNTGQTDLTDVVIKDYLPQGLSLTGKTEANVQNGSGLTDLDKLFTSGVKVAKVGVGGTVTITFNVRIDEDKLVCGTTVLTNVVGSTTAELANEPDTTNNTVKTIVDKDCQPLPKPCPTNPSLSEDDPNCKPCQYDSSMNFDNPNCKPPIEPVIPGTPTTPGSPTPTPTESPTTYTPSTIVATGPKEFLMAAAATGALTTATVGYVRSRRALMK